MHSFFLFCCFFVCNSMERGSMHKRIRRSREESAVTLDPRATKKKSRRRVRWHKSHRSLLWRARNGTTTTTHVSIKCAMERHTTTWTRWTRCLRQQILLAVLRTLKAFLLAIGVRHTNCAPTSDTECKTGTRAIAPYTCPKNTASINAH